MLVDKLCTIVDVILGYINIQNDDLPEDLKERLKNASQMVTDELNFILDWVSNPVYSFDHPYGNKIMKDFKNNFDNKI